MSGCENCNNPNLATIKILDGPLQGNVYLACVECQLWFDYERVEVEL